MRGAADWCRLEPASSLTHGIHINPSVRVHSVQGLSQVVARDKMQESTEVNIRTTQKMQRIVEPLVNVGMCRTKSEFVAMSIEDNIMDINKKLRGQKNIKDFIKELNSDVEWINIKIPDNSIHPRLEVDAKLDVRYKTDVEDDKYSILKRCSRSSGLSKSSIVRICMMKKCYDMRSMLPDVKQRKVETRWGDIKRKLDINNMMLIDKLYYYFSTEDYIQDKVYDDMEIKNVYYLKEHYKQFKNSAGYECMTENERGKKVIGVLESIPEKSI